MKSGDWDYKNPELVINIVQVILLSIPLDNFEVRERAWIREILWFWHHHAIGCAIWVYRDKAAAKDFARKAIFYQNPTYSELEHPNKITILLYFLVNDQIDEAEEWASKINVDYEIEAAEYLIQEYHKGRFL